MKVVVRFGLDPIQMLGLIRRLGKDELAQIKKGQIPKLDIPYETEATARVTVESLGRRSTSFGPAAAEARYARG